MPVLLTLVLALLQEAPAISSGVQSIIDSLKDSGELTPEQLAQVEATNAAARAKWQSDLSEDAPKA